MEESTTDIIGIFAAVALMFLVPLVLLADRNDDISQLIANSATSSFVENIIKTGTITSEDYANYINQLNSSGNTYDVSIEIKVLDPNYAQEYTNRRNELGSNQYYSIYTTQIEEKLSNNGGNESNKKIVLKDGDYGTASLDGLKGVNFGRSYEKEKATLKEFFKQPLK